MLQHKCIEPLGESKSDYQIFLELSQRLGLSAYFGEAKNELLWCRESLPGLGPAAGDLLEASCCARATTSCRPRPRPPDRTPVSWRWFAEGRKKDVPEPAPLPSEYGEEYLQGLQTQSGKIRIRAGKPRALRTGSGASAAQPLHSRRGRGARTPRCTSRFRCSSFRRIRASASTRWRRQGQRHQRHRRPPRADRRLLLLDRAHEPRRCRAARHPQHELVRLFNDRGAVICAAVLTERVLPGVVHSYTSAAIYEPVGERQPQRGPRRLRQRAHAQAPHDRVHLGLGAEFLPDRGRTVASKREAAR